MRDSDGNTLLHWAVLTAKPTLASALVDHGVDVNALNHRGVTALYYASMLGDGGLCTLLVNQGARVNLHSMGADGPGEHAVLQRKDLIDVELEDEIGLVCTPVQAATVQGHFRVVLFLVQKGADVNIPAHGGNTALHYACMKSYVGLASFLVESGAALDARNDEGKVPADVAEDGMKDLLLEAKSPAAAAAAAEQDEGSDGASQTKKKLQFNDEDDIKLIDKVGGADCGEEWYKDGPGPHVFGKAFYDSFGASEWKTRVAALKVLIRDMALVQGDPALLYQSACAVLSQAFNDKVAQVYLMSLELLRKVISVFSQKVSQSQLVEPMHGLMATVIPFTGKSQEKVRNESFKAVLFVARQPAIGPALVADLVLNQKKKENAKKWRPLYGRLKILAQMVFEFKFSETNGLSIGAIMEFAAPAFEHPNEQVRKAAVDLFVESYMLEGAAADGYIATLKPALQAMIRDELASIDAPVAPPVAEKPPPTASRLTDDTATSRPVTGAARPNTGAAGADGAEAMPYAAPIKEDGQAASAHIVQFFGDETARCFVGKSWQSRVAALQKIEGKLAEVLDADNEEVKDEPGMADAAYRVVFEALRDPVPHVYTASLALLNALAAAPEGTLAAKDPGAEVLRGRMIRAIVAKLGDRNARIRTRTEQTLLELARLEAPYGVSVVAEHTANPNPDGKEGKEGKPSKATEPQLKLLNTLIQQFSLADEGALSLPSVMALTVPAFEDRDKKVRKVAVAVYVSAWKRVGSEALASYVQHLKPAIRKVLKAKTEGKATSAENAGKDGVEDGGIMFFNADEMKAGGGAGGSGGDGGGEAQAQAGEALPYASSLPADLQEAVKPLAEVFGDDTMQCFYSKQWAPREAALRRVEGQVRMMDGCDRRIFLYVVFMLESALADKIAHVLWGGLSLLRTVVANYAKDLAPVEVQYSLEKLMPKIVTQLGNTNARTSQACEQTCQFLSWKPNVGGAFIARHILSHDHKKNVKSLEVKLVLLAQLVNDFGIGEESISAEDLFAFARPCFEHRSDKVREAAVRVYVAAHKFIGATANDLIGDVKPALRSVLSKAALDDPHTNNERPKTPAAFIFDRPSTAAERLTHSLALGGVGLSAAPILAQAGLASVAGSGEASSGTDGAEGSGAVDAQPVVSEREKALAAEKATDAELNELTGLSGSLDVLKRLFGTDTLLQFRDPDASEREESLEAMQEAIWSNGPLLGSEADVNASFEACCHLVKHALSDKAIAVMCAGLELLKTVIVTHSRKLGAFEFRLALGSLATTILGLSADGPIRVRGKSDEMAVFLAHQPKLGVAFLSRYLLENAAAPDLLKRKDGGRAVVLARLKLLVDLLGEVSAPGGSEQVSSLSQLTRQCSCSHHLTFVVVTGRVACGERCYILRGLYRRAQERLYAPRRVVAFPLQP